MPNYRELLNQVKAEIEEIDAGGAARLLESDEPPALVDVREQDEWDAGTIPGAIHIPRGFLAARAPAAADVDMLDVVALDGVARTNLQRQIGDSTERLGEPKAESAKQTIEALNPDVKVKFFKEPATSENVDRILGEGWDAIV